MSARFDLPVLVALGALSSCGHGLYDSQGRPDIREVGPEGAVLTSRDGRLQLDIPPGALRGTTVSVTEADLPEPALGTGWAVEPLDQELAMPATVAIREGPRSGSRVAPGIAREGASGQLEPLDPLTTTFDGEFVRAATSRFGVFAAFQPDCSSDAGCEDGWRCLGGACVSCLAGCSPDACGPAQACPSGQRCVAAVCRACSPVEVCANGLDDDCNGRVDDGCEPRCSLDADCPGGGHCVAGACTVSASLETAAGCGCSAGGEAPLVCLACLAAGMARRRAPRQARGGGVLSSLARWIWKG